MSINTYIRESLLAADRLIAKSSLAQSEESGSLLSFLFHNLYKREELPLSGCVDPHGGISVEMFSRFIDHFQSAGYLFVAASDVAAGLPADGKYVLLTFDDGYYNNVRALPVLEKFGVPAILFVPTKYIREGNAFWWIVAEREALKHGDTRESAQDLIRELKRLQRAKAEAELQKRFGAQAFQQDDNLHRPMTPGELKDFSQHPLISVGNHTSDHASLTNYPAEEAFELIQQAQDDILEMTGKLAQMIAYPHGEQSPEILGAARRAGLRFGVGVRPGHNELPMLAGSDAAMEMRRFTLTGHTDIEEQCRLCRSRVSLLRKACEMKSKARDGFVMPRRLRAGYVAEEGLALTGSRDWVKS